jgi:hypothetical protein
MTYKKEMGAPDRGKSGLRTREVESFLSSSYINSISLRARTSRFCRCAVSPLGETETSGGIQKRAQASSGLKPLFPQYFIGVYVMGRCSVG